MKITQAIQKFLTAHVADSPFLIPLWSPSLETQVMTTSEGEQYDGPQGGYTADGEVWKNARWPYQAGTNPNYSDPDITYSPDARVEKVGTTWWDWENKKSIAIGIDIDYQEGHAPSTVTNEQKAIDDIVLKLKGLDYVTIVRSTGGKGIHVYVFFDTPPEARNHHEHTIVARKTLELISQDIKYDLKSHVDCVGSVFWIWSKNAATDGFSLVKSGGKLDATRLALVNLPQPAVAGSSTLDFETIPLDARHKGALEAISRQPFYFNYRSDINLVHAHTCAIAAAHAEGAIKGNFVTSSSGSDPLSANCFMAPQPGGSFRVVRFGQAKHEPSWQFANGKNFCFINEVANVQDVIREKAGKPKQGKYKMSNADIEEIVTGLGESLGGRLDEDTWLCLNDDSIEIYTKAQIDGWDQHDKNTWKKTIEVQSPLTWCDRLLREADDKFRHLMAGTSEIGWLYRMKNGVWARAKSFTDMQCMVRGVFGELAEKVHELMMEHPWQKVSIPFNSEYPGDRQWNIDAPQLLVEPSASGGDHPHYDLIMEHVGGCLNDSVQASDWCRRANIHTGADYIRAWYSCLINYPDQPLPYLFASGPQNSGKSIMQELTRFLFTGGVCSAASALTSAFNAELEGCFLVYVEERDMADKRYNAYTKIKEWTTAKTLNIVAKYQTPREVKNYLHFMQMSNNMNHLPMEDGDTRIVAVDVPALKVMIPKQIMERHLEAEAPRFLRTLLNMVIPPSNDRMRLPTLTSFVKNMMEDKARSPFIKFSVENLKVCTGHKIELELLYSAYQVWCQSNSEVWASIDEVRREMTGRSEKFEVGVNHGKEYLVNVTLDPSAIPTTPITVHNRKF